MGALLCDRNHLDDAMTQAREAVRLDPANPRVHALEAQIHAKSGEWEDCRKDAERGLTIDPSDEVCVSLRALALRPADSQEDWIAAVDDLMRVRRSAALPSPLT